MDPLFRPEVVQQSRRRLEGAILLATPLSTKFLSALFVSIILVAGVFLCLGAYARKETAIGAITTQGWTVPIVATRGGVIDSVSLKVGDRAPLGATIATLHSSSSVKDSEGGKVIGRGDYTVTSPTFGWVAAIPFHVGQTAPPGATVAVLVPAIPPRGTADLYVSSRAAVFIRSGQPVNLMYQAFPYQKFGVGHGRILSVATTPLSPDEATKTGLNFREPMFRVRVMLDRSLVTAYGQDIPLRPGMLLTADIVIDRRSLIEWLLDPIYAVRKRIS